MKNATHGLECQRAAFSLPPDAHYLNCAYMGPLPRAAEEAGIAGLRAKRFPQAIAPADFFAPVDALRARFARLIGAPDPNRIATVPAVSYAISTIARNTEAGPGRNIVLIEEQFPGNVYPWRRLVAERGGTIRMVERPAEGMGGERWTERILESIDDATAAVAMGTVHWTDGTRFDLGRIRERTREVGAALVLDGTQSVGATPFDVAALDPDALVAAGYKWLLGPYSLTLAWFGKRYLNGIPLEETWGARRGSENFAGLVDYTDAYQSGARRFDVGQRSNFALVPALTASIDLVLQWGPARISAYVEDLTRDLFPRLRALGVQVERSPWRSPHLFGLGLPAGADPGTLKAALDRRRVGISFRGPRVRVSPNVYNTPADVEALVAAFEEGLR